MHQIIIKRCLFQYRNFRFTPASLFFHNSITLNSKTSNNDKNNKEKLNKSNLAIGAAVTVAALGLYKFSDRIKSRLIIHASEQDVSFAGRFRTDLPNFTLDDVSKHDTAEKRIWITYKQGVYDVTEFVKNHPGGDNILLAAGNSVEPFWLIYGIHKTKEILTMLEEMRIGNISVQESKISVRDLSDPYANEPRRHPVLKAASQKPFNAEPVSSLLVDSFITPNDIFYVRNHLPVPVIDPETYELEIEIEGKKKTMTFTLDDLRKKFRKYTITSTVMCAGNRRSEMTKIKPVKGLDWGFAAVGNATWSGARLKDVLNWCGVTEEESFKHVQFEGLDTDPTNSPYGASIPFHKAINPHGDVLLAYEMNGEALPRDHGYPLRVIVPGTVGARNVKWLGRIVVAGEESSAFWQRRDYKGFGPSTDYDTADFDRAMAIQELPVTSAICMPQKGDTVERKDGCIVVKGYAWSGGGQKIIRIDVTADGGKTWHVADIDQQDDENEPPKHWAWTLWSCRIPISNNVKKVEVWSKAVDSSYNTQPESFENIWNLRGVLGNAYHRVPIFVK